MKLVSRLIIPVRDLTADGSVCITAVGILFRISANRHRLQQIVHAVCRKPKPLAEFFDRKSFFLPVLKQQNGKQVQRFLQ